MEIDSRDLLDKLLNGLDGIEYIDPEEIPNIALYMDQVTTFMDSRLRRTTRYPEEDKVLTKTMINNYAKNNLLPPPVKKKYSKEHMLLLIFIYYFKGFMSIGDIQTLLGPLTEKYFPEGGKLSLKDIYNEVFDMGKTQVERLKEDVKIKYELAQQSFGGVSEEEKEFLEKFSFICLLSLDVYVKKMIIEKLVDELRTKEGPEKKQPEKKTSEKKQPVHQ